MDTYQGEAGPIERYSTTTVEVNSDSDSSNDVDEGSSDNNNNNSDDLEDFVVDDDIIDGEKNAVQDSEMAFLEMPGTKGVYNSYHQVMLPLIIMIM